MPPNPPTPGPSYTITPGKPYIRWSAPVPLREALSVVCKDEFLMTTLQSYVSASLQKKWPQLDRDRSDDLCIEAISKLIGKTGLTATFGVLVGSRKENPLAPYVLQTAIRLELDHWRQEARDRRLEEKRQRELALSRRFEISVEDRTDLEVMTQQARPLIEHRHWNELLQKVDPRWNLTSPAFQPWPGVERADRASTRRSDVHRARDVLRDWLRASTFDTDLILLFWRIFFGRCKP